MNRIIIPIAMAGLILAAGCAADVTSPRVPARPLTKTEATIVAADNVFGFDMLNKLAAAKPTETVIISPVSISMALGMTMNGARGETFDAMRAALRFGGLGQEEINASYKSLMGLLTGMDPHVTMTIANSIWYDQAKLQVSPEFVATNKEFFNADTRALSFSDPQAAKTINGWVDANTGGKIKDIVPDPIPSDFVMYLINALYFKGTWRTAFDPKNTRDDHFTTEQGATPTCRMMHRGGKLRYANVDGVEIADLPYGDAGYSMTVVLPKSGTTVRSLAARLTPELWKSWTDAITEQEVAIDLPKFKLEYKETLNDVLIAAGMGIAFSGSADFSGITASHQPEELAIGEVKHKVFIDVNEEGTEAAAATSVGIIRTSMPPTMSVDRPFLFAIRESTTGAILFLGIVMVPSTDQ